MIIDISAAKMKITHVPINRKMKNMVALTFPVPYPIGGASAFDHSPHKYFKPIKHSNAQTALTLMLMRREEKKLSIFQTFESISTFIFGVYLEFNEEDQDLQHIFHIKILFSL